VLFEVLKNYLAKESCLDTGPRWVFFQLGAREHYAVPRALQERGTLAALFTDAWADPQSCLGSALKRLSSRLATRFDPGLKDARVEHFTSSLLWFEARHAFLRSLGTDSWESMIARNRWFQQRAVRRLAASGLVAASHRAVFHAFSYAAREIFAIAKRAGHFTVLQQIDPGLAEEEIVAETCLKHPYLTSKWAHAPFEYWQEWLEECRLADVIVVNSEWSRRGLVVKNIPSEKIVTVPLMYDAGNHVAPCHKNFPRRFEKSSPLKVLFLGNLCLRKGIAEMLEAVDLLSDAPVSFCFVGPSEVRLPEHIRANSRVEWRDAVPRVDVHAFYRRSHIFILPTHSDGFGLTQLEAQSWGLPVIASSNCGQVVRHGENGLLLPKVSGPVIAEMIEAILKNPAQLPAMSIKSKEISAEYSAERIIPKFLSSVGQILENSSDGLQPQRVI
jgi:glycosyltransferase involved in cell wall biosynthesis